jgi:HPt (histidine-containing phosphotransfer) domain-containing protein
MSGPAPAAPLDLARLEAFAADVDDAATVDSVLDAYLGQLPVRCDGIALAASRGDLAAVADLGHALRASSAMLGAHRVAELASTLESMARAGRLDEVQATAIPLADECAALDLALRAWRRR